MEKGNLLKISTPGVSPITTPNKKGRVPAPATGSEEQDDGRLSPLPRDPQSTPDNKRQLVNDKTDEENSSENIPDEYKTCQTMDLEDEIDSMVAEPWTELPSQNMTMAPDSSQLNKLGDDHTPNKSWHPTQR